MKVTLNITDDHIKLIKGFRFRRFNDNQYGVDNYDLFGGTYLYEDMAMILGVADKIIPETLENPMGARYQDDVQSHLEELADDIFEHLSDYEDILHQFCDRGGLKPGKYTCIDNIGIWNYVDE